MKTIETTAAVTDDRKLIMQVQLPDDVAHGEHRIVLVIDEPLQSVAQSSPETSEEELRLLAAVKLYELERLSSGAAAQLAGLPRTVFLSKLGVYGVPTFRLTE